MNNNSQNANQNNNLEELENITKPKKNSFVRELVSWIILFVGAIAIALIVNKTVLANTEVPTGSMENTIHGGDRLFGFRLAYTFSKPERGDVIIFKYPDNEEENYIKRIIGMPGEKVEIIKGVVYINGEELEESYLKEKPFELDFGPYEVPDDSYFVLGDNRNGSHDARRWNNTYVHKDKIIAKAIFKYYPDFELIE